MSIKSQLQRIKELPPLGHFIIFTDGIAFLTCVEPGAPRNDGLLHHVCYYAIFGKGTFNADAFEWFEGGITPPDDTVPVVSMSTGTLNPQPVEEESVVPPTVEG